MAANKQNTIKKPGLRVTAKVDGFRRGGREWHGEEEVLMSDFSKEQLKQIRDEGKSGGKLVVQDINIDVVVDEPDAK